MKVPLRWPMSTLSREGRSTANCETSLRTFRECSKVVSCQLLRLRMLPNDHAMKASDTRNLKTTVVSRLHERNAKGPTLVKDAGSVREVIPLQPPNEHWPMLVNVSGNCRDLILRHPLNALLPMVINDFESATEVRLLQQANA